MPEVDFRNLRSVRQLAEDSRGTFTEASIRWAIFNAASNGFDAVLVRVGRRVLIDLDKFNTWLAQQQKQAA